MKADERFAAGIEHRPGDSDAANRVGPIEDDEPLAVLGTGFHRLAHRRNIGVKPAPMSWMSNTTVSIRPSIAAVGLRVSPYRLKTFRPVALSCVSPIFETSSLPSKPCSGLKRAFSCTFFGFVQQLDGAFALAAAARVVGDQADFAAGELAEVVAFQHVDAG